MPKALEQSANQSAAQGINISSLRRKRGNIVGQITMLENATETARQGEHRDVGLLQTHVTYIHQVWERFDEIQFDLEEIDETEAPRRSEITKKYLTAITQANALLESGRQNICTRRNTTDSTQTITAPMTIKLPEMRLPTFDGTIENWTSYFDSFSSMIDQNSDLTSVQKLQYLRSTLTGRAAASIQCLSTTDANYVDAIEILKEKFDCKRRILKRHCDAILEIPKLSRDSPEALGELVDTIRQNLRSLKNLRIDTASWDCMLVSIILSKLSADTAWHWELTLKNKDMPSHKHLLEFIEKRANCAPAIPPRTTFTSGQNNRAVPKPTFKQPTKGYAFATAKMRHSPQHQHEASTSKYEIVTPARADTPATADTLPKCPVCHGPHGIWRCENFHSSTVEQRLTAVKRASLCRNCLRTHHDAELCRRGTCRICQQPHHTLLHQPQREPDRRDTTVIGHAITPLAEPTD